MTKKKGKTYSVTFRVVALVDLELSAASIEDALAAAKTYGVTDVVEINGGHTDSSIAIASIGPSNGWNTDQVE